MKTANAHWAQLQQLQPRSCLYCPSGQGCQTHVCRNLHICVRYCSGSAQTERRHHLRPSGRDEQPCHYQCRGACVPFLANLHRQQCWLPQWGCCQLEPQRGNPKSGMCCPKDKSHGQALGNLPNQISCHLIGALLLADGRATLQGLALQDQLTLPTPVVPLDLMNQYETAAGQCLHRCHWRPACNQGRQSKRTRQRSGHQPQC
mmetsp:Transcript_55045/g.109423  ORF Transcript_55045/g.109423 Transcript_55045/m.109423 type:complete len:203 (-) Transcript_55045:157-765(-)